MPEAEAPGGLALGQSEDHFAAIVANSDDAILSKDRDGIITSWNPAAERMYGYAAEEAVGRPISILIPQHRVGEEQVILARVLSGERVDHYETERVTKDGRMLNVSLTVSPVRDAEGTAVGASVIARDVTARQRALALAGALQEVSTELASELASERIIDVVLRNVTGALGAPAGAVGLVAGDEIELAGNVGHSQSGLAGWERFPVSAEVPMARVVRSGEALWAGSAEALTERFPSLAQASIRLPSLAVLPLTAAGTTFGALSVSFQEPREFELEERAFLMAACQQAAYAMERARRFEAERLTAERQRFLAEAGELLAESLDPNEALSRIATLAVRHIADWCGVDMLDEEGGLRPVAVAHADPEQVRLAEELRERYPPDPDSETGVPNVIRTGVSELYPEIPDELLRESAEDEEHERLLRALGLRSGMVVPLRARGRVFGAITFVASDPARSYDESDVAFAEDLARRAALAVDNAMLFRREHDAAVTLQRSLLPESLPQIAGIELDARYRPAAPGLEVGGDWYEVVGAGDGSVAVTIGDVAGRGVRAASVMGRIRLALRAYVLDGHGPSEALARLDRLMKDQTRPEMVTLFHLQYEPESRRARYVRAGHPPALILRPGGEVTELDGAGPPPLGILDGVDFEEHSVEVPPGSLVVLYTDGLIERRESDLDTGLDHLKRTLASAPAGATECLDWIESTLGTEAIPDDVAMLAMATGKADAIA